MLNPKKHGKSVMLFAAVCLPAVLHGCPAAGGGVYAPPPGEAPPAPAPLPSEDPPAASPTPGAR